MAATEEGHHSNRIFVDQDGDFHVNGASFYNGDGNDIAVALNDIDALSTVELALIDGVTAGTITASKAVIANSSGAVADADLLLESTNEINITIGGTSMMALDDAAISSNAAAGDAAGKPCFVETQDGGTDGGSASTGQAAGALSFKCGDGSAAVTSGAIGGAGGAVTLQAGAGAAGDTAGDGGVGGDVNITSGAGGADGGSGTDGASGDIVLTVGAISGDGPQGHVKLGSAASWTATGSATVTFETDKGPTGIGTATIAKWLTMKDDSGTVHYIPCWT